MNVLLISPLTVQKQSPKPLWAPLGLAFIGAVLESEGHKVSIFDRHVCLARTGLDTEKLDAEMIEHIKAFAPDLIGMTTISPMIYDTAACIERIRKSYRGLIVAGGHHATALPELTLSKIPGLDGLVVGEGEIPMAEIGRGGDPESIPGVWWRSYNGNVCNTAPKQITDLDCLPFPSYDLLDMSYYTQPGFNAFHGRYISSISVLSSRGCTQRCEFCSESLTYGRGVRFHSTSYIVEWIDKLLTDYKIGGIYFLDNNFLFSETRAREICEKIIAHGLHKRIKWVIQARADAIHTAILGLLKRAGCVAIEIGVEAASQKRLDAYQKATTVKVNEKAISMCRKEGLSVFAYMITGFPEESISDLEMSLKWIKRAKPTLFGWSDLQIYPGTALYTKQGGGFFEGHEWNQDVLDSYYRRRIPDSGSDRQRSQWMDTHYLPYHTWRRCLAAICSNSLITLIRYALKQRKTVIELFGWLLQGIFGRIKGKSTLQN